MKNVLDIHNNIPAHHTGWHIHDRQTMTAYAITCTLLSVLFLLSMILPGDTRNFLIEEGGIVESASVFAYFLGAMLIIYNHKTDHLKYFFVIIIFFMLRELDFDKRFTTMGIFKIRFFTGSSVPFMEKVIGAMVILLLVYVFLSVLYQHSKDFFMGLKKGSAVSFGTLLTITLLLAARITDGLYRKLLKMLGIALSKQMYGHISALEEISEMAIPTVIFITLNAYFKAIKISQLPAPDDKSALRFTAAGKL